VLSFHWSCLRRSDDLSCKTQNGATEFGRRIGPADLIFA
jgi:hypothetical protein